MKFRLEMLSVKIQYDTVPFRRTDCVDSLVTDGWMVRADKIRQGAMKMK